MVEPYLGMRDVLFSYEGDVAFQNGDFVLTTGIDYIEREIYKLLITAPGDWRASKDIGCTPALFIGEQNTREIAQKFELFIVNGLKKTVFPGRVTARVIPTNINAVMCLVTVYVNDSEVDIIPFEFDFVGGFRKLNKRDDKVVAMTSSDKLKVNDITANTRPNQYWSRLKTQRGK